MSVIGSYSVLANPSSPNLPWKYPSKNRIPQDLNSNTNN
jgi:hypothetical protein